MMEEALSHQLIVCRTCPRPDAVKEGLLVELRARTEDLPEGFEMRVVECLGGCPWPHAVAFNAPDKWRVRLTGLAPLRAADVMRAAHAYRASHDGYLVDADLPSDLRGHITARSPVRPRRADASLTGLEVTPPKQANRGSENP